MRAFYIIFPLKFSSVQDFGFYPFFKQPHGSFYDCVVNVNVGTSVFVTDGPIDMSQFLHDHFVTCDSDAFYFGKIIPVRRKSKAE